MGFVEEGVKHSLRSLHAGSHLLILFLLGNKDSKNMVLTLSSGGKKWSLHHNQP